MKQGFAVSVDTQVHARIKDIAKKQGMTVKGVVAAGVKALEAKLKEVKHV